MKNNFYKSVFVFVFTLLVSTQFAYSKEIDFSSTGVSKSDKEILKEAVKASRSGDYQDARAIARDANHPIIYKIILWREFKNARKTSSDDIRSFLASSENWPLVDQFKRRIGINVPSQTTSAAWRGLASRSRDLLEEGDYDDAYDVIRGKHEGLSGADRADALWMSGWINLRFLKRAQKAAFYFETMAREVQLPVSKSRAYYWTARAYEDIGNRSKAREWYEVAAKHDTYYYGQLAALRLDDDYTLTLPDYPPPDYLDAKNFLNDERILSARILDEIGDNEDSRLFLIRYLGEPERTVSDYLLLVLLAQHTTNYEWAVMAGKKAAEIDVQVPHANYPLLMFSPKAPEKALVMAITRQESQLNRFARSPVGAAGMMQLMPSTAANVAKMMGVPYKPDMLWDKDYNMSLGSYYLAKRINDFKGSYILAIASYNGGIGNVMKWIKRFGDPRGMNTYQVIDWIESIPFSETRNYVQRVIEATGVYRARLNNGSYPLLLVDDIKR